ncbi:MAG: hypothetical protein ACK5C5_05735 [Bacteroidota bacterium]|jgi:hypothetical protein
MIRKISSILVITALLAADSFNVNAQDVQESGAKAKQVKSDYNRPSLTVLVSNLGKSSKYTTLMSAIKDASLTLDKFDNNNLKSPDFNTSATISSEGTESLGALAGLGSMFGKKKKSGSGGSVNDSIGLVILSDLVSSGVPNQVIQDVFQVSSDGTYSMDKIASRGLYNADKSDATAASASKRGMDDLKDAGIALLSKMYIMVLGVNDIQTMTEYYDAADATAKAYAEQTKTEFKPVKRDMNGFMGSGRAYLYKIDFNDSLTAVFWQDYFSNAETHPDAAERSKRLSNFKSAKLPVTLVAVSNISGDGNQYNPDADALKLLGVTPQKSSAELLKELSFDFLNNAVGDFERSVEDFQVRAQIAKVKPIQLEIGKKEGLKRSDRYFVYESVQNEAGEVASVRRGVIRAKKVIDNRQNITEFGKEVPTSVFYQTSGRRLDEGMVAKQKNDLGIGIGVLAGTTLGAHLQYNVSTILDFLPTELYIYGAGTYNAFKAKSADIDDVSKFLANNYSTIKEDKWTEINIDAGLEKRFMISKRSYFGVNVGYSMSTLERSIEKDDYVDDKNLTDELSYKIKVNGAGINAGANIGRNFGPNLSIGVFARYRMTEFTTYEIEVDSKDSSNSSSGEEAEKVDLKDNEDFNEKFAGIKAGVMAVFSF